MTGLGTATATQEGAPQGAQGPFTTFHDLLDHLMRQHQPREHPVSENILKKLPEVVISKEQVDANVECSVCKEEFEHGEIVLGIPCGHLYHEECISPWLKQQNTCPNCRYELPVDDPEYEVERKKRMASRNINEDVFFQQCNSTKSTVLCEDTDMMDIDLPPLVDITVPTTCDLGVLQKDDCVLLSAPNFVTLKCGHHHHHECLQDYLRVSGELLAEATLQLESQFRCPVCRKATGLVPPPELD